MSPVVPHFEVGEEGSDAGAHIVNARGELHLSTAPELGTRLTAAIEGGNTRLVLDLSGVEFIDSTGLSTLLTSLRLVTQNHGSMAIVCANPTVLRLFQITSLDETFDIFADRPAAIAHVTGGSSGGAP